jgi:hypothetical protein
MVRCAAAPLQAIVPKIYTHECRLHPSKLAVIAAPHAQSLQYTLNLIERAVQSILGDPKALWVHSVGMCGLLCRECTCVTMQSERGRITAALNADQLIGRDYSKLSLGVRSRYKTVNDSEALLCDAEPLVRHSLA